VTSEDAACILVRFEDGARGTLLISQVSAGRKNAVALEIGGADASLAWRSERPDELWIGHRDTPNELLLRDPALMHPEAAAIAGLPGGHAEGFENGFKALYASVYADVAVGAPSTDPPYATFEDGHREALLIEAVARSAETGSWAAVGGETGLDRGPTDKETMR
jgi:predicted dehydrogenase